MTFDEDWVDFDPTPTVSPLVGIQDVSISGVLLTKSNGGDRMLELTFQVISNDPKTNGKTVKDRIMLEGSGKNGGLRRMSGLDKVLGTTLATGRFSLGDLRGKRLLVDLIEVPSKNGSGSFINVNAGTNSDGWHSGYSAVPDSAPVPAPPPDPDAPF